MPIPTGERPFDILAAELMADEFAASPVLGSALGLTEYDEWLPDLSADAIAARERAEDEWSARLGALDDSSLTAEERVDRDLALMVLRGRAVQRDWADWRRSPDHYAGTALTGVFNLLLNRLRPEPELSVAVAARLKAVPLLLEQGTANLDPALAHPALLRRSLGQIGAGAAYARSVASEFSDEAQRSAVAEAGEAAAAAFERFGAHVESLVEKATGDWAIGEARYDALLRQAEGLGYGTRELREKGQAAYDELSADMRKRAQALRGTDDFLEVLQGFNDDHPETPEEMLALYQEATDAARAFCVEHELVTMPEGERCVVAPSAPFTRAMLAVAHYMMPPPFAPPAPTALRVPGTSSCPTRRTGRPPSRSPPGWRPTTATAPGRSRSTRRTPVTTGTSRGSRPTRPTVVPGRCASCSARRTSSRAGVSTPRTCWRGRASSVRPSRSCASATSGSSGPPGSSSTPRCTSAR